jgi:prolyl oligopeptidase
VHFLNEGGVYVFACIRGGGEFGKEWFNYGRGKLKIVSFADFIMASEFLINSGYTSPSKLAISGSSNGGLVVGVAMTQRPELFKVAVPFVAPLDMVRFEEFTIGHYHKSEYGSSKDTATFKSILTYSPFHNINEKTNYPATLVVTSEFDDRVPPFHSYKFAAKLQSREAQTNPVLLKVNKKSGHYGDNKSFKGHLREEAMKYDFILYHLLKN